MRADRFISFILHDEILVKAIDVGKEMSNYEYRLMCDEILINALRVE
jgi:hypothetical protein